MKSIFMLLTILSAVTLTYAQTVPDDIYLNSLIEKKSLPLSHAEMERLFSQEPLFSMDCAADSSIKNEKEAEEAFSSLPSMKTLKGF